MPFSAVSPGVAGGACACRSRIGRRRRATSSARSRLSLEPSSEPPLRRARRRELNQSMLHRVPDQIRIRRETQLLHEARSIGAHRLWREAELRCHLPHRAAHAQPAKDVELAIRELLVRRADEVLAELRGESLGERRTHVTAASMYAANRVEELLGGVVLR